MKRNYILVFVALFGFAAFAQKEDSLSILEKADKSVVWDRKAVEVDLNKDGKKDAAYKGDKNKLACVGAVVGSKANFICFDDAGCGSAQSKDLTLSATKEGVLEFGNGQCDSHWINWNKSKSKLEWNRN